MMNNRMSRNRNKIKMAKLIKNKMIIMKILHKIRMKLMEIMPCIKPVIELSQTRKKMLDKFKIINKEIKHKKNKMNLLKRKN